MDFLGYLIGVLVKFVKNMPKNNFGTTLAATNFHKSKHIPKKTHTTCSSRDSNIHSSTHRHSYYPFGEK